LQVERTRRAAHATVGSLQSGIPAVARFRVPPTFLRIARLVILDQSSGPSGRNDDGSRGATFLAGATCSERHETSLETSVQVKLTISAKCVAAIANSFDEITLQVVAGDDLLRPGTVVVVLFGEGVDDIRFLGTLAIEEDSTNFHAGTAVNVDVIGARHVQLLRFLPLASQIIHRQSVVVAQVGIKVRVDRLNDAHAADALRARLVGVRIRFRGGVVPVAALVLVRNRKARLLRHTAAIHGKVERDDERAARRLKVP